MSKEKLKENAAGGSVGASAIAVSPMRQKGGESEWKETLDKEKKDKERSAHIQAQLKHAKELKAKRDAENKKKRSFTSFFKKKISEDFDMASVVSKLKGEENRNSDKVNAAVSYGIEDDKGNFMRVTVRSDQAKEFEMTIARKLADNKDDTALGLSNQKTSLAELLFGLQDQFDILDVEFPIIPKDAVYNAGDATVGEAPVASGTAPAPTMDDGMGDDFSGDTSDFDANGALDGQSLGSDDMNDQMAVGDEEADMEGVEDFGEPEQTESDPVSLLKSLVDMLKKQAEAETAKANASAEQYRASQAEWSAISAEKEVRRQEEIAKVDADLQEKKRREKMAKQYADIAKYNVEQGKSALNKMENYELDDSILDAALLEDSYDNVNALQKAKQEVMQKYQINANDDALDKNYKAAAQKLELDQINSRINLAKLTDTYNAKKQQMQQQQQQQNNQQNQNNTQPTQSATNPSQPNQQANQQGQPGINQGVGNGGI